MSENQLVLTGRESLTSRIGRMIEAVQEIDTLTNHVKGVREQLSSVYHDVQELGEQALSQDEALVQYQEQEQRLIRAANEMQNQRDAVLDEMSTLLNRLRDGDFFNKDFELGRKVYQAAMETHNEAFWESLPYDMAERFGKPWTNEECDFLVSLLIEDEETMADDRQMDVEDIIAFRSLLFDITNKLYTKEYGERD